MTARPPLTVTLPVLGLPTRFQVDSAELLVLVRESFGAWAALDAGLVGRDEPFVVRVLHCAGDEGPGPVPVRHRCPDGTRLFVQSPGSMAVSDPVRREAVAYVTAALVADRMRFRTELLEAITLALLSGGNRHPVHAAALAHGGGALLLTAPSGTGKSTLAYLAQRAGVPVLSEDRVWVQRSPALRVWGWPDAIRLRGDAPARFPELAGHALAPHRHGPPRFMVPAPRARTALVAEGVTVCAVERGRGPATLRRAGGDELVATLERDVAPGFDRFPASQRDTMRAIAGDGGWRLRLSDDPHEALPLLRRMLDHRN